MNLIKRLKEKYKSFMEIPLVISMDGLSFEDFMEWERVLKSKYPVRYFVNFTLPQFWNRFSAIMWHTPVEWLTVRTVSRAHVLHIKSLKPLNHDECEIMLHANFQILVNFVEKRLSQVNYQWWDERRPKGMPKLIWNRVRWFSRTPEAGINHLKSMINEYPHQVHHDIYDLYMWWTNRYTRRLEEWSDERIWGKDSNLDEMDKCKVPGTNHPSTEVAAEIEEYYKKEENVMLERLIKIRSSLWF
jgi:hypothetical protein